MKITIVLGSIREERKSDKLAYYLEKQLLKKGVSVRLIDLKKYSLPLFGFPISKEDTERVAALNGELKESEAVILVTPEYHSNISAALKNALEYCGLNFIGKVTGIASASATKFGGVNALYTLQNTLLNLGAYLAPKRLMVPEIHLAFSQENEPVHGELEEQADKFLNGLLGFVNSLEAKASLPTA